MRTHVEFVSDAFPPYPDEDEDINPGIWGRRLAEFLVVELSAFDIASKEFYTEDWGWEIPLENAEFPMFIGCSNQLEPEGNHFLCFIDPCKPEVRVGMFKKVRTVETVARVAEALDAILHRHPQIRNIQWWAGQKGLR